MFSSFLKELFNSLYVIVVALGAFFAGFFYADKFVIFGYNPCKINQEVKQEINDNNSVSTDKLNEDVKKTETSADNTEVKIVNENALKLNETINKEVSKIQGENNNKPSVNEININVDQKDPSKTQIQIKQKDDNTTINNNLNNSNQAQKSEDKNQNINNQILEDSSPSLKTKMKPSIKIPKRNEY